MPELEKAKLQEVRSDSNETPVGNPVPLQFNPASLKLTLKNEVEGGRSRGRQRRQHTGSSSTTLSMDLIFDSADETETEGVEEAGAPRPVSVREKTAMLEKYVVPKTDGSETPPRVRFEWKELILSGIVEGLDIGFELFAPDGTPLRAKTKLTIKEQDPKYQYLDAGPGARDNAAANQGDPTPGGGTNDAPPGPGSGEQPSGTPSRTAPRAARGERRAPALEGETPPEFAARNGLDPEAWRALDMDLGDALSLPGGLEVGFSPGLSISVGVGVSAGFSAGIGLSLEASLGLEIGASASVGVLTEAGVSANTAAGLALAGAGGIGPAIEQAKISKQQAATGTARSAFTAASVSTSGSVAASVSSAGTPAGQSHSPLSAEPEHERISRPVAASATRLALADPRATSYGAGVPLRPLIRTATEQRQPTVFADEASIGITPATRTGNAPWERLPTRDPGRTRADKAEQKRRENHCLALYSRPAGRLR